MNPRSGTGLDTGDSLSPGEAVYRELRNRLVSGAFPLARRLAEERLANLLGVSRTPVRHALIRLHSEGLVARHPEGGYRPAIPDLTEIGCLYEVRRTLEIAAIWRPSEHSLRHDPEVLEPLRDEWRVLRDDPPAADPGFVARDEDFHVRLAVAAGNSVLAELLRSVNARIRVIRVHDFLSDDRITQTITEHLAIAEAVMANDPADAEQIFRAHVTRSKEVSEERALRALARMVAFEEVG